MYINTIDSEQGRNKVKYNYEQVWEAVYRFAPVYKVMREESVPTNLPEALKTAAVTIFLEQNSNYNTLTEKDMEYISIVRDVLNDLKKHGRMLLSVKINNGETK